MPEAYVCTRRVSVGSSLQANFPIEKYKEKSGLLFDFFDKIIKEKHGNDLKAIKRWSQAKVAKLAIDRLNRLCDSKDKYYNWLKQIQLKSHISGLCPNKSVVLGETIVFPFASPEGVETPDKGFLELIPSDLSILLNWRDILFDKFLELGDRHSCNYYYMSAHEDRLRLSPINEEEMVKELKWYEKAFLYQPTWFESHPYFILSLSCGLKPEPKNTFHLYAITDKKTPRDIRI